MMTWTQKETSLLKDLKNQEQLCVDKYGKYADEACDPELKQLFRTIQQAEQGHLQSVTSLLNGQLPQPGGQQGQQDQQYRQQIHRTEEKIAKGPEICPIFLPGDGNQGLAGEQVVDGHGEKPGNLFQRNTAGVASAGFPFGNSGAGHIKGVGKLFLGQRFLFPEFL